jgi:hypothetical protein
VPVNNALQRLWDDYNYLKQTDPRTWSEDDSLSIRFFVAEQGLNAGTSPAERSKLIVRWITDLLDLENWIEIEGAIPRQVKKGAGVPNEELQRHLVVWIDTQRRALPGTRSTYQLRRLECVSQFQFVSDDELWLRQYRAYEAFLTTGDVPGYRRKEWAERRLANWAAQQRFRQRHGSLKPERRRLLEILRVWTW